MLSRDSRKIGFTRSFATHDDSVSRGVIEIARRNRWKEDEYEFEMLYGVRPDWQQLRALDVTVRVCLPFGTDWWPYAIRRVGENPRNILLLGRALVGSRY
jgi:proline dehydrogenase